LPVQVHFGQNQPKALLPQQLKASDSTENCKLPKLGDATSPLPTNKFIHHTAR